MPPNQPQPGYRPMPYPANQPTGYPTPYPGNQPTAALPPQHGARPVAAQPDPRTSLRPHRMPPTSAHPHPGAGSAALGGPDGAELVGDAREYLDYLSGLCKQLGVQDPVEEYLHPVIGRWSALHEQAEKWRRAARTFEEVSGRVTRPLGRLDTVWEGKAAESFVAYMQKFAPASASLTDAMHAMADALDHTANSIRELVKQMIGTLTEHATAVSGALVLPLQGEDRALEFLDQARRPTKELFDAVHDVMAAFAKLCKGTDHDGGFDKVAMSHQFPTKGLALPGSSGNRVSPTPHPVGPQPVAPQPNPHRLPPQPVAPQPIGAQPVPPQPMPGTKPAGEVPPPAAGVPGGGTGGVPGGVAGGGGMGAGGLPGGGMGGEHLGGGASSTPLQPGNSFGVDESAHPTPVQSGAAPAPAAAHAPSGGQGSPGGMGMMGGGGGMGGQGGDQERKSKSRISAESAEIFGKPEKTAPPVIGA